MAFVVTVLCGSLSVA
ncbi:hypothetical protein CGG97_24220 [Vibrio parahaemolyticus]|nr:hypothetical protein CGG97_24220 [Vibrio parahaemolyticus]